MLKLFNIKRNKLLLLMSLIIMITVGCSNRDKDKDIEEQKEIINNAQVEDENSIEYLLADMSLEEKIGQLLMPDFRKWYGKKVTTMNDEIASLIKEYHIGGVILFKENFVSRTQTKQLIQDFQDETDIPLMFGVDQEGGLVTRIPFFPKMPGNMALGATNDKELARQVGLAIGSELANLGIQINFGPVVDVNSNPNNPIIGVRSFGDDIEMVSTMGIAYMQGLNDAGVAAVGKHFPGHGDVNLDSHYVLPKSNKSLEQLREIELKPFQAVIDEGIQGIMTAHITFEKIDPDMAISKKDGLPIELPATLSSKIMTDLLRREMGFDKLIFTDAMNMLAIANHFDQVEAAIRAIDAGIDVILMPGNIQYVYEGLLQAVETGRLSETRIDKSVRRILEFKNEYILESNINRIEIDAVEALKIEMEVAESAITMIKNDGIIPLNADSGEKITVIGYSNSTVDAMKNAIKSHYWRVNTMVINKSSNLSEKLTPNQKEQLGDVTKVVVVTNTSNQEDFWQVNITKDIIEQGIPTIVVAARNPYDSVNLLDANALIAQYDTGVSSFNATGQIIFGKLEATGVLPVRLSVLE